MRRACHKRTHCKDVSVVFSGPGSAGLSRPAGEAGLWAGKSSPGQRLGFTGCWLGPEEWFPAGIQQLSVSPLTGVGECLCYSFSSPPGTDAHLVHVKTLRMESGRCFWELSVIMFSHIRGQVRMGLVHRYASPLGSPQEQEQGLA